MSRKWGNPIPGNQCDGKRFQLIRIVYSKWKFATFPFGFTTVSFARTFSQANECFLISLLGLLFTGLVAPLLLLLWKVFTWSRMGFTLRDVQHFCLLLTLVRLKASMSKESLVLKKDKLCQKKRQNLGRNALSIIITFLCKYLTC